MNESAVEETDERDLAWYASVLDEVASTAESDFELSMNIREKFGLGLRSDLDESTPIEVRAIVWAVMYVLEFDGKRARLVPRENYGTESRPPRTREIPEEIRAVWRDLLPRVDVPIAKARLAHVVFQCGGAPAPHAAELAIASYIEAATAQRAQSGRVEDLRAASRIARTVHDDAGAERSLNHLLDLATATLDKDPGKVGLILRPLAHVVDEPMCPDRIDVLLERAAVELPDADDRDHALTLMQKRCGNDDPRRAALWERRVAVYLDAAEQQESAVMQLVLRQDALRTAESSKQRHLYRRAAAALQGTRDHRAEMIHIESSSALYEEEFLQARDGLIEGDTWKEALVRLSMSGPLSGDYEANLENTTQRHALSGLSAMFPTQLMDSNGLPIYKPETEEERIDFELTRFEAQVITGLVRPLISAIDAIPERFGLPATAELGEFLSTWPAMSPAVALTICSALQRFWVGDVQATTYTLVPAIETLVRDLILRADHGMYRLQQSPRQPGQYPGLGVMIDILPDYYDVDEGWVHSLKTILVHPAGLNIRNRLCHGIDTLNDPGTAAIILHTALWLAARTPISKPETDSAEAATQQ